MRKSVFNQSVVIFVLKLDDGQSEVWMILIASLKSSVRHWYLK